MKYDVDILLQKINNCTSERFRFRDLEQDISQKPL